MLLILAVVTISAVNEGSLFSYANNAAEGYSKAQEEENTMISNWLTELAKHDKENENTGIEYYSYSFYDNENLVEFVVVIDYQNNKLKVYGAENGENFEKYNEADIVEVITDDFTVNLDGVDTVISNAKGIKVNHRGNPEIVYYIKDNKLYEAEAKDEIEFYSDGYYLLDPNFDTSRLPV